MLIFEEGDKDKEGQEGLEGEIGGGVWEGLDILMVQKACPLTPTND